MFPRDLSKSPLRTALSGFFIALAGAAIGFTGQWLDQRWMLWIAFFVVVCGIAMGWVGIAWGYFTMVRRFREDRKRYPAAYGLFLLALLVAGVQFGLNIYGYSLGIVGAVIFLACGIGGFVLLARQKLAESRSSRHD